MKQLLKSGLLACLLSMAIMSVNAQIGASIYVGTRPARPAVIVHRPPAPSRNHVWVDEEWVPQGNSYAWHGGYWAAPPRAHAHYVAGHWSHTKHGHIWIAGYWK